ncbi:BGLU42 [Symbiodinium pilosum]|uniref:BGLU42 protein n=1 Tax=Symbiodinium pilosum TaxID=2952 RepID=A0A812XBQ8_SYMPI|nr:BGLU42 [Symbiodinium pilosum]
MLEGSITGSEDLEHVFRENLIRAGQMVAILDSWQQPTYLSRVWTIYAPGFPSRLLFFFECKVPHKPRTLNPKP